jgi:cytochrome P450
MPTSKGARMPANQVAWKRRRPPGPRRFALWALIPRVLRDPLGMITSLPERYGDVVCVGSGLFYLVWRPEHVEHILALKHTKYGKGESIQSARAVFGNGLVTSDGDLWRRQRRLIQPSFQRDCLIDFGRTMVDATLEMLDDWKTRHGSRATFDISTEFLRVLGRVLFRSMFGGDLGDRMDDLARAQAIVEDNIDRRAWNPFRWTERLPTRRNREYYHAIGQIEAALASIVETRRARGESGATDLLGRLLAARDADDAQGMSERQLRDEAMTFFFTGYSTTAHAMSWAAWLLARHPDIQERMREEVSTVVGDRPPTPDDVQELGLGRRVFQETLRLYPPAWVIARTANEEDEIAGYAIPPGRAVLLGTYITHHHPELWHDPERFDPDRFLPEQCRDRPRFAFYPFGGGARQCIGERFAFLQALVTLSMILQRYRIEPAPGADPVMKTSAVLKPRHGIRLTLVERQSE